MTGPMTTREAARSRNVVAEDLRAAIRSLPSGRFAILADLDVALETERRAVVEEMRPYLRHLGHCRQTEEGISILHDSTIIPPCSCGLDSIASGAETEDGE